MPRRAASAASSAKARADVFDALHKEMEIAEYSTCPTGQRVRKVPRAQAPKRTAKRKALQKEDLEEMAIEVDEDEDEDYDDEEERDLDNNKRKKRLRGTRVAFEDVILKSMPLGGEPSSAKQPPGNNNSNDNEENEEEEEEVQQTESERYEMLQEVAALGIDVDIDGKDTNDDNEGDDDEDNDESGDEEVEEMGKVSNDSTTAKSTTTASKPTTTSAAAPKKKSKKNRILHRMREFSSQRLAQQHGEAIAAHVRGMSDVAVEKLSQVAKAAPTAPQVYSSLGMVYESMLTEIEKELNDKLEGADLRDKSFVALVRRQLELARKTYGSYHVASLLCKRDFVLWERSGDAAIKVTHIYDDLIMMYKADDSANNATDNDDEEETDKGFNPKAGPAQWRSDRKEFLEHALSAYDAADKLRPPGVDIPCKLAEAQMNLGNYIQALAILTDLRNKANGKSSRSGMEESPPSWLLYAELMLKIGYECKKWNDSGSLLRQRNTFKRWLRKYSKSFDWKERRLQALCLALEAAAGSASCSELVEWMRKRAQTYIEKNEKEDADIDETATKGVDDDDDETENDVSKDVDENGDACVTSTADDIEVLTYEQKRDELVEQNKSELFKFDAMTKEMNLAEISPEYRDRVAARVELVETQRNKIKELALKEALNDPSNTDDSGLDPSGDKVPSQMLPVQSSCASVYDICRLLLRQCLHLGLHDGGVIVVQSVLKYLQERALRYEGKHKRQQNLSDQLLGGGAQAGFAHDQMNDASDESDDDSSIIFLSDDEDLEEPGVLQSLKSGVLPIDINTMYSVCLLGTGGQDYAALNNLENTLQTNHLDMFDGEQSPNEDGIGDEHNWIAFRKHFASPLGKTSMIAIIADVVKDRPPGLSSRRILGIFRSHLKLVDRNDGLDDILSGSNGLLRANMLQILLAAAKLSIRCDALEMRKLNQPGVDESEVAKSVVADVVQTLTTLTRFQHIMWNPNSYDWSLKGVSVEMLSIFCEALDVLVKATTVVKHGVHSDTLDVSVIMSRCLVSTIFQAGSLPAKPGASIEHDTWKTFPLPNEWQTDFERKLSLKSYNLCVACCVSAFSGWETEEFSVDKLRSRDDDTNLFGITFANSRVAGFLSDEITSSISQQWQRVQTLLPNLEALDFDTHLDRRKEAEWYQKIIDSAAQQRGKVSTFGEDDGIKTLLSFSMLCLIAADAKKNQNDQGNFLKLSMSILLPITQFIIDKHVWASNIGVENKNDKDEVDYYLDEKHRWMGQIKTTKVVRFQSRPKPTVHQPSQQLRQKQNPRSFQSPKPPAARPRPKITKLIKVPTSVLLDEWSKDESPKLTNAGEAERAMKKMDYAMKNLRKSRTLNALEQSSLDVSAALIDVAATEECYNPFLCLQQAAMYAELGSKLGSNDEPFKKCLPSKERCTALEALVILGRADCLRAIHFLHEAQYLCSWVISVCRLHRDRQEATFLWNDRWRVIGVLCYVTKATIDQTGEDLRNNKKSALTLRKWEDGAQEEANRGKSDALVLVGTDSGEVGNELPQIEVDDNTANSGNDSTMIDASQHDLMLDASQHETGLVSQNGNGLVAEPFDFNQLGELPVPVIEDVQMGGEYDGIQVVGI